jgi:hypothetical protein
MTSATLSGDSAQAMAGRRGHVAVLLPRGETLRNFVYTGALDQAALEVGITPVSVIPDVEYRDLLRDRYGSIHELVEIPEHRLTLIVRELLDMAHGRHLWSQAAQQRWRLRDSEAVTMPSKVVRAVKKAIAIPLATSRGVRTLSSLERFLSRKLATTNHYTQIWKSIQPTLVFNTSHVHSTIALQAVQAAQWLGIKTATFIFSWDNLTSQGRIIPAYDYYLVWNADLRRQLLSLYPDVRDEQIVVTGTPQFDSHFRPEYYWSRRELCMRVGADPERPLVLYTTGMPNHMPREQHLVEQIADMLGTLTGCGNPQLLVRVYAKDRSGRFEELKSRRKDIIFTDALWHPNWLTPKVEDLPLLTNLLRHADVGINVASTVSLELAMFDKPVLNLAYNADGMQTGEVPFSSYYDFEHYSPLVEKGAVYKCKDPEELRGALQKVLSGSEERQASHRRLSFINEMFGDTLDGKSGERVAKALVSLART